MASDEPVAHVRRELREGRAHRRAGQHVARNVHSGVDAFGVLEPRHHEEAIR